MSVKYLIRLNYAKKMKIGNALYPAKIAVFYTLYPQKKKSNEIRSEVVLRARVLEKSFVKYLRRLGFKKEDGDYYSTDSEIFYRAMIYATLLQCTKDDSWGDLVEELPYIAVKYWASTLQEFYLKRRWRRDLYKPIRAFREVYSGE